MRILGEDGVSDNTPPIDDNSNSQSLSKPHTKGEWRLPDNRFVHLPE